MAINTQYSQSYGAGYIARRTRTDPDEEKTEKAEDPVKSTPELESYKKEFLEKIRKMTVDKQELTNTKINIDIDNAGFEKMRTDAAYEKKVLSLFQAKVDKKYPLPPVSLDLKVNADGESADIDYGNQGDLFEKRNLIGSMQRAFLKSGVNSMRSEVLSTIQTRMNNGVGGPKVDLNSLGSQRAGLQNYDFYA